MTSADSSYFFPFNQSFSSKVIFFIHEEKDMFDENANTS